MKFPTQQGTVSEIFCSVPKIMPYAMALYLLLGFICSFIHQFKYLLHGLPGTGNTKVNKTDKLSKAEKTSSMIPSSKALSSELSELALLTTLWVWSGLSP